MSFDQEKLKEYQAQGNTISFLLIDEELVAFFAMGDSIKPQAKAFIKDLRNAGIEPVMLTGDNQEAAKAVADYLGLKEFFGELLPDDKEKLLNATPMMVRKS